MPEQAKLTKGLEKYPVTQVAGPDGRRIDMAMLLVRETPFYQARILVSLNCMKVYVQMLNVAEGADIHPELINNFLYECGVRRGIDPIGIQLFCETVARDPQWEKLFEIARGTPPRRGRDETVELHVMPTSRKPRYEEDESGSIDYRRLHLFENVTVGQQIGCLNPPTEGEPGMDVLGNDLSAADGRPADYRLGSNVELSEDGKSFVATAAGRVEWFDKRLSVETDYHVQGDVDYSVGHIDFLGSVYVHGDVLNEFNLSVGGDLEIKGQVGACRLVAGGDIVLRGGMNGRGEGEVLAGGKVSAKYLNELKIEAKDDVLASNEIVGCRICSLGAVKVRAGAIVGGETIAFKGIESLAIGSGLGVTTEVAAGLDFTTEHKVQELDQSIEAIGQKIIAIDSELQPLLADRTFFANAGDESRTLVQTLIGRLKRMRDELARAEEERAMLVCKTQPGQVSQVNARDTVYAGVSVRFSHARQRIKDTLRGPVSIIQETKRGIVKVVKQRPLEEDKHAGDMPMAPKPS